MQGLALAATDLACQRGGRHLFATLSLTLAPGGALWVTGANGAGKTSLLRILARLLRADAGRVRWEGNIGLLDDRLALDRGATLGAALGFWARVDGVALADRAAYAARVGLSGLEDVPVDYLSTGQRRRAGLARLLGQGADHWLLDEPLNGLDAAGVGLIEALIAERRAGGGAVIVASHQPITLLGAQVIAL